MQQNTNQFGAAPNQNNIPSAQQFNNNQQPNNMMMNNVNQF